MLMFGPVQRSHPPHQTSETDRIQRLSAALAGACLVLIVILPLLVPAYWLVADTASLAVRANLSPSAMLGPLQLWQRAAGALLTEVPVILISLGMWQARMCFSGFARGQLFTSQAVRYLRSFAAWTFASALAAVLVGPVLSVVLTLHNPAGMRHLAIGIGSDHMLTLLFATMVWLMAAVIGQGRALAEENAAFL